MLDTTLNRWALGSRRVVVGCGRIGFAGLNAGPSSHFIDSCGLADPLLARLPAKVDPDWRIGHFDRALPANYEISISLDENLLTDTATKRSWDTLRLITRGPVFSLARFKAIALINCQGIGVCRSATTVRD